MTFGGDFKNHQRSESFESSFRNEKTSHIADRISKVRQTLFALRRICSKTWGISPILANHLYGAVEKTSKTF